MTHKYGGHLDQVFAKNIEITNAVINDDYDHRVTDHKTIKVTLKPKITTSFIKQYNPHHIPTSHLVLKQGTLRKLVNLEQTVTEMIEAPRMIARPAYEYIDAQAKDDAIR